MSEIMLGGFAVVYGGESLGTGVRWRRLVVDAIAPFTKNNAPDGADAFGEFVRAVSALLTLEAKLALVFAWQPELAAHEADILERATDEELGAVFDALIKHAYPLALAARRGAPTNGAVTAPGQSTARSYG